MPKYRVTILRQDVIEVDAKNKYQAAVAVARSHDGDGELTVLDVTRAPKERTPESTADDRDDQ